MFERSVTTPRHGRGHGPKVAALARRGTDGKSVCIPCKNSCGRCSRCLLGGQYKEGRSRGTGRDPASLKHGKGEGRISAKVFTFRDLTPPKAFKFQDLKPPKVFKSQ